MSAINEALKKARDQNPATTTATGNNGFHLIPGAKKNPISSFYLGLSLALAAVLVGLGIYFMRGNDSLVVQAKPVPALAPVQQQASMASLPAPSISSHQTLNSSEEVEATTDEGEELSVMPSILETNLPAIPPPSSTTSPEPSVDIPGSASAYPSLRLQGIFYRKGDAFVILNSKTLTVGDKVDDVTVTEITSDTVVLRWNNEIKTLTLR